MNIIPQKVLINLIKPWELLNENLVKPNVLNHTINDYIVLATDLASRIYHFPEIHFGRKDLMEHNESFSIIRDLNNSTKHGNLYNIKKQCQVKLYSLIEKGEEEIYRFSRNKIEIVHSTYGNIDFMYCSMNAIIFINKYFNILPTWAPAVRASNSPFVDIVSVYADCALQVEVDGWYMKFVKIKGDGSIEILPKPMKFKTTISHNWKSDTQSERIFTLKKEDDGTFTVFDEIDRSVRIKKQIDSDGSTSWVSNDRIHPMLLKRIGRIIDSAKDMKSGQIISENDISKN